MRRELSHLSQKLLVGAFPETGGDQEVENEVGPKRGNGENERIPESQPECQGMRQSKLL